MPLLACFLSSPHPVLSGQILFQRTPLPRESPDMLSLVASPVQFFTSWWYVISFTALLLVAPAAETVFIITVPDYFDYQQLPPHVPFHSHTDVCPGRSDAGTLEHDPGPRVRPAQGDRGGSSSAAPQAGHHKPCEHSQWQQTQSLQGPRRDEGALKIAQVRAPAMLFFV